MLSVLIRIASILMSTHNIQFNDKIRQKSLNICFLELLEELCRDWKKEFESSTVNEPSVFEPLRLYCIVNSKTVLEFKTKLDKL